MEDERGARAYKSPPPLFKQKGRGNYWVEDISELILKKSPKKGMIKVKRISECKELWSCGKVITLAFYHLFGFLEV